MKRIRALSLAAVAVAALAALPAVASASGGIAAGDYPATLSGKQLGTFEIKVAGSTYAICNEATGASFEATLSKPSPSVTTSSIKDPTCEFSEFAGSLKMGGCQLEFYPSSETVGIGPSGCGQIAVPACAGVNPLIQPQTGITAKYENFGSGSGAYFRVTINDSSITYKTVGTCKGKGPGTYTDLAISNWQFKVTAADSGKSAIGTSAYSSDLPQGLALAGGEPRLTSPEYPVLVKGERFGVSGQITLLELPTWDVSCSVAELDGGELSGPAYGTFSLNAAYPKCIFTVKGVAISESKAAEMKSCHYVYSNLKETESVLVYTGTSKIVCTGSDTIKFVGSGCSVEIAGQTLAGAPTEFVNLFTEWEGFSGYEGQVGAAMSAMGVTYKTSGFCPLVGIKNGTFTDGSLHSDMLLKGIYPG